MEKLEVYKAISSITDELAEKGIKKEQVNKTQGYKFRGIDDIYNTLAKLLAKYELCIIPNILDRKTEERQTLKGGCLFYTVVKAEYKFISAKDGSTHIAVVYGEAMDSADKSTNKAMSAAYKYLCLQTFCIPTEGDNDSDAETPEPLSLYASSTQIEEIEKLKIDKIKLCQYYGITSLKGLTREQAQKAIEMKKGVQYV